MVVTDERHQSIVVMKYAAADQLMSYALVWDRDGAETIPAYCILQADYGIFTRTT